MDIKVIAFDADDTLWVNEPYFRETETVFAQMLEDFMPLHSAERALLQTEIKNLPLYGYGIKGFTLSMIETALTISEGNIKASAIARILELGKELLARPIELLEGVEEVVSALKDRYRLVVATKGDLLDQERKMKNSGIIHHFHHIEIMSEKGVADYTKLVRHLDIAPEQFLMIGNSLKSDVLPVLELGGHAIHVPYHTTWAHEVVEHAVEHPNFRAVASIREVAGLL
ncbi:MAG: HAD family hydrolase [Chitinophagaceae bacterium]|nr:MAG: HAD family hydrolase [Chitinophagaceae bacterium]